MSTGAEHYREAEKLLARIADCEYGASIIPELIAEAHVHATLALAAAQAMQVRHEDVDPGTWQEWRAAVGDHTAHPELVQMRDEAGSDSPTPASCDCSPVASPACGHCAECDVCQDCGRCAGRGCRCSCEEQ